MAGGREQRAYRVALNPAASPKEIDLVQLGSDGEPATYTHGPGRGSVVKLHGVYSVNKRYELLWTFPLKSGEEKKLGYQYSVLVHN